MAQATVAHGLAHSVLQSIERVGRIAKDAFYHEGAGPLYFSDEDIADAISSLVTTVDAPPFASLVRSRGGLASEFIEKVMPGFPMADLSSQRPSSPMVTSRPNSPFSGRAPFASLSSRVLDRDPKSPSPKSPPHKRQRAGSITPVVLPARRAIETPLRSSFPSGATPIRPLAMAPMPIASSSSVDPGRHGMARPSVSALQIPDSSSQPLPFFDASQGLSPKVMRKVRSKKTSKK
jgi:hypothetical protein